MTSSTTVNHWDEEVDLLVIGAGAGGMTAALVAKLSGLDVLVCEKTTQVGGTAATSAGTVWIPGNSQSTDAGWHDSPQVAREYMRALTGGAAETPLLDAFFETGPSVIDYLRQHTDVQFVPSGKHPDYKDLQGAAVFGRTLAPAPFDGRLLGADFARVRPPLPEFMVLGGMMVGKEDIPKLINRFRSFANFLHAAKLFTRYVSDRLRYARGTRVTMGNALVARLYFSLKQNQVKVSFESVLSDLVTENGSVVGALVESAEKIRRIRARRGVVLATGGYGHSQRLRRKFMLSPTPKYSVAHQGNTGDGIEIGLRHGGFAAPERHGSGAFWTPVSVVRRPDGSEGVFPHLSLDRAKPGLIAVNSAGRRFVNEGASYHDFVEAMYASHRQSPTIPAYLICEADFVKKYGLGYIHPGTASLKDYERNGYLLTAPTLEALARRLSIDANTLIATVDRANGFARSGIDSDFGKGSTELSRFNGDPANKPNPCLGPIERGPFVALALWPAEIATSTGLQTDADGRVLDPGERAINGLYACGNDMASIMLGTYPGPGTTLGPAITFGYRVARHAATQSTSA